MREKSIDERKRDKQYLEIQTSKDIKQVLNLLEKLIAGQRFGELDTEKQIYLFNCQARINEMQLGRFTEEDIVFILKSIDSLTKTLFSAKDELENILY